MIGKDAEVMESNLKKDECLKRLDVDVECGVCGEWFNERELGIGGKNRRWIKRKFIRCRLCLMIDCEMAWRMIEEVDKEGNMENFWEKIEKYTKKETEPVIEHETAEEIITENEVRQRWEILWKWRTVLRNHDNENKRKKKLEKQRQNEQKIKDYTDRENTQIRDKGNENRQIEVAKSEDQQEQGHTEMLQGATALDIYQEIEGEAFMKNTEQEMNKIESAIEEIRRNTESKHNIDTKYIVQESIRQERTIVKFDLRKDEEKNVEEIYNLTTNIGRGSMRGRRKISLGRGEMKDERRQVEEERKKGEQMENVDLECVNTRKKSGDKTYSPRKWEGTGTRPKEKLIVQQKEEQKQTKEEEKRIEDRTRIEEGQQKAENKKTEEPKDIENMKKEHIKKDVEFEEVVRRLREDKKAQEEKISKIEKDIENLQGEIRRQNQRRESDSEGEGDREERKSPTTERRPETTYYKHEVEEQRVVAVGDSMLKKLWYALATTDGKTRPRRNRIVSYEGGAKINQIMSTAREVQMGNKGGIMIIQGGGNDLTRYGAEDTWETMKKAMQEVWRKENDTTFLIVGVTPRPKEGGEFEKQRERLNELMKKQIKYWQNKRGEELTFRRGVFFLDIEEIVKVQDISWDGVHPNEEGYRKMYKEIAEETDRLIRKRIDIDRKSKEIKGQGGTEKEGEEFREIIHKGNERLVRSRGREFREIWTGVRWEKNQ